MIGTTVYMAPEVMNADSLNLSGNKSPDELVMSTQYMLLFCYVIIFVRSMKLLE